MTAQDIVLDFSDLEPQKVRVPIGKRVCWLFEASGDAAIKYRNASLKGARIEEGKSHSTLEGIADAEVILVANCLYWANDSGDPPINQDGFPDPAKKVGELQIRNWTGKVQKGLFDAVHKLSPWLRERGDAGPKEPQGTTTASSASPPTSGSPSTS